jgi:hypothetical protein
MFNAIKLSLIEERNKARKETSTTKRDNDDERSRDAQSRYAARFLPSSAANESTYVPVAMLDLWSDSKAS